MDSMSAVPYAGQAAWSKPMKHINNLIALVILGTPLLTLNVMGEPDREGKPDGTTLTLMTYNLKFASPTFKPSWEVRREMQVDIIREYSPDIIGTQEGLKGQIDYLDDVLTEYVVIGEGRQGGDDDEHMAIFFKRDRFRLREMGSFQLSETPDIIGSGPDINPRMVTWARLAFQTRPAQGESGPYPADYRGHWENTREIYVFNTHFFNRSSEFLAKWNSTQLILDRIHSLDRFGEWTKERPVFLLGDFNSKPGGAIYTAFVGDGTSGNPLLLKDSIKGGLGIDWILYRGNVNVTHYEKIDYNVDGAYPSDHKPVIAEFQLLQE
jgi:endonuclease/exonuclease/phosphatase family metal-dependent hydrolase